MSARVCARTRPPLTANDGISREFHHESRASPPAAIHTTPSSHTPSRRTAQHSQVPITPHPWHRLAAQARLRSSGSLCGSAAGHRHSDLPAIWNSIILFAVPLRYLSCNGVKYSPRFPKKRRCTHSCLSFACIDVAALTKKDIAVSLDTDQSIPPSGISGSLILRVFLNSSNGGFSIVDTPCSTYRKFHGFDGDADME